MLSITVAIDKRNRNQEKNLFIIIVVYLFCGKIVSCLWFYKSYKLLYKLKINHIDKLIFRTYYYEKYDILI